MTASVVALFVAVSWCGSIVDIMPTSSEAANRAVKGEKELSSIDAAGGDLQSPVRSIDRDLDEVQATLDRINSKLDRLLEATDPKAKMTVSP
jgi:peptidoglycan hydrolase CwlO-like protein